MVKSRQSLHGLVPARAVAERPSVTTEAQGGAARSVTGLAGVGWVAALLGWSASNVRAGFAHHS